MSKETKQPKRPKQPIATIIGNNLFMLGRIAKYAPAYFFASLFWGMLHGVRSSMTAIYTFYLLNAIDEGSDFSYVLKLTLGVMVFFTVVWFYDSWYSKSYSSLLQKKLHLKMHEELFVKARSLDIAYFDDPEFYNDFVWAMNESDRRAIYVMNTVRGFCYQIVSFATSFTLILSVKPTAAIIVLASSIFSVICSFMSNKVNFAHRKEGNPLWRKHGYLNRVYHLPDYAKEIRVSHANDLLLKEYDETAEKQISLSVKYGKKYFLCWGIGWEMFAEITRFIIIFYMMGLLAAGEIAIGGFVASITLVLQMRGTLSNLLGNFARYAEHSLYIEKYREFLRTKPTIFGEVTEIPEFETLEFRGVSFSYEFSSHAKYRFRDKPSEEKLTEALKDVNLTIRAGDKIAIVGYNGAGKTTLIKLMMRLYDPTKGQILYNGVDIRTYNPDAYRQKIGTVFQDFQIFAATVAENVVGGEYDEKRDRERVLSSLEKADFSEKLSTLPNGILTPLTRQFDDTGVNLSGGESQKVAIACVFAQNTPIMIMDEPSSALDPMAEYHLNQSILHHTEDKTVIFISHRLSTTRIADRIYMFDTGRVVEEGSHEELLSMDGKYAEMFRLQSEKYRTEEQAEETA